MAQMHQTDEIGCSQRRTQNSNIPKQRPSNLAKLLYVYVWFTWLPPLPLFATIAISMDFVAGFFSFIFFFIFVVLYTAFDVRFVYVCVCMSLSNSWTNYYCRMKCCWFWLQFLHRLQCLTKFQCEVNNEKKQQHICLHFRVLFSRQPSDETYKRLFF